MTAKEFCKEHKPMSSYNIFAEDVLFLHGIEFIGHGNVFISHTYGSKTSYHKMKILSSSKGDYIKFQKSRIYLDEFTDIGHSL